MDNIVFRCREYAVRLKRAFAWSKESLNPLATHPVVVYVTQKSHLIERREDVLRFLTVRVEGFEQSNSSRKRERDEGRPPRREGETPAEEGAQA